MLCTLTTICPPPTNQQVVSHLALPKRVMPQPHGNTLFPYPTPRIDGEPRDTKARVLQMSSRQTRQQRVGTIPTSTSRGLARRRGLSRALVLPLHPGCRRCRAQVWQPLHPNIMMNGQAHNRQRLLASERIARSIAGCRMIWHHTGRYGCEHMHILCLWL